MDEEKWQELSEAEKKVLQNAVDELRELKERLFENVGAVSIFNNAIQHLEGHFDELITELETLIDDESARNE